MAKRLKIQLPEALASELAARGLAEVQRTARSATWELVWNVASDASAVVSLLQTPEVLKSVAAGCLRLVKKDQQPQQRRLDAKGPGGQLSLVVTSDTDMRVVEQFLEKVLFVDVRTEDDAR
jgi:hypothetical protein